MATDTPIDPKTTPRYIGVTHGISGYFAVHIWWNGEEGGFWEPWQSGLGRYATQGEAIAEAKSWAEDEGLPYHGPADKAEGEPA